MSRLLVAGQYRDAIAAPDGVRPPLGAWRHNRIVASMWPLVAALLRNEPGTRGILYCAFGEGATEWDRMPATPSADTTRLVLERARVEVPPTTVKYLDGAGRVTSAPTHRLTLDVTLPASKETRLFREFGLFGGQARAAGDSGTLINHAIHPRIELAAGKALRREVRLSFRPGGSEAGFDWLEVPHHPLEGDPVTHLDGVGAALERVLEELDIRTIGDLAHSAPPAFGGALPATRIMEARARARLALQTASQLRPLGTVDAQTVAELLAAPPADLARQAGRPVVLLEQLQEQLALLQLALDARVLKRTTLASLTPAASRAGPP